MGKGKAVLSRRTRKANVSYKIRRKDHILSEKPGI
jgi:hypothetical protein